MLDLKDIFPRLRDVRPRALWLLLGILALLSAMYIMRDHLDRAGVLIFLFMISALVFVGLRWGGDMIRPRTVREPCDAPFARGTCRELFARSVMDGIQTKVSKATKEARRMGEPEDVVAHKAAWTLFHRYLDLENDSAALQAVEAEQTWPDWVQRKFAELAERGNLELSELLDECGKLESPGRTSLLRHLQAARLLRRPPE